MCHLVKGTLSYLYEQKSDNRKRPHNETRTMMLSRIFEGAASAMVIAAVSLTDFQPPPIMIAPEQTSLSLVKERTTPSNVLQRVDIVNQSERRLRKDDASAVSQRSLLELMPLMLVPDNVLAKNKADPIIQGLIYFANPSVSIPKTSPTDTIVLQVTDLQHPNEILAAAKIPLNRVRLPLSFQMFPKNVVPDKFETWKSLEQDSDLLVQALVCPETIVVLPCSIEESVLQARGIAKVVRNLPGFPEGVSIRAAASLPLE